MKVLCYLVDEWQQGANPYVVLHERSIHNSYYWWMIKGFAKSDCCLICLTSFYEEITRCRIYIYQLGCVMLNPGSDPTFASRLELHVEL